MRLIQFQAVVGAEQVIRPPEGVTLPEGAVEVTVRPVPEAGTADPSALAGTRGWLLDLAAEAERSADVMPADLAEHHDHYAHGTPLG